MTALPPTDRPLRADAERNRRRVLAAAADLFAERGLDVSLDEIAAAAGVGVGTVYRRFPDKDALIDALFAAKIGELEAVGRRALELDDPWASFEAFFRSMAAMHATDRGLKEALLAGDRGREWVKRARETIAPIGRQVLERAQADGAVRADLAVTDLPLMFLTVGLLADRTRDIADDYWQRTLTLLLDGLRPRREGVTELPARPLAYDELPTVMSRRRA